ncbi:PAS domain S-box protein [Pseudobdellovibrio sp. HCB154]|uniref:PAS domain S-box protein n=1 Tax=Pseudobdellovibrio sp. HCB154 TaxID=3386277 RepID=UPI003916D6FA
MQPNDKDQFKALTEIVPVGIFLADQAGVCSYANNKWLDISGLSLNDVLYKNWLNFIHPEDQEKIAHAWKTATSKQISFQEEFRFLHSDGEVTWVNAQANPSKDQTGKITYAGAINEISERIKEKEISRENAERFTNAFEYAAIGMALISLEGGWIKVNQSVCDLLGYTKSELMQLTFQQITHPDDLARDLDYVRMLLDGKIKTYGMEKRYFTKSKQIVWAHLSVSLVRNQKGDPLYFISQIVDITDRKRMEDELRENEQRLLMATTSAKLGVWDLDLEADTLRWNDRMYELYGVKRETYQPSFTGWKESLHPDDLERSYREFQEAIAGARFESEFRVVWPDGTVKHINASAGLVKNAQGVTTRMMGINQDITEYKNAILLKSRFLDIAAHELRTPVTAFNLILQLTQKKLEKGEAIGADVLTRLQMQTDRITRLVVDLLDVSRLERGVLKIKREATDISKLISNCISEYKLRFPKREMIFAHVTPVTINVDPIRIYQVISNLLDNACKYTPENSPIEISLKDEASSVSVAVTDHGPGIPDEHKANLFTIFSRGSSELVDRAGGLGLGLFICQSLVELHQGKIEVASQLGQGTTFTFKLPHGEEK